MKKIISGKVREVYDLEDGRMVIVTTDRISAFDVILPTMITGKGKVLNALSNFWFDYTKDIVKNHMISSDLKDMPTEFQKPEYEGRTILVKKLKMIPYEVIVRGYMFGSMYDAYKKGENFLGHKFDKEYQQAEKLDEPIVTPSTKAAEGHDINVTIEYMKNDLGEELGSKIEKTAIAIYKKCYEHAYKNGIIIADTKFEFGLDENGELVLGDDRDTDYSTFPVIFCRRKHSPSANIRARTARFQAESFPLRNSSFLVSLRSVPFSRCRGYGRTSCCSDP